ncbi:MAG: hypothetical protein F082_676 [bacterium F082]|nr:MAG: hypothetical protein F082_676 [bacterium F082]KWW30420.1 MAG: hypothetical protein AUK64_775 [bacterium P201]
MKKLFLIITAIVAFNLSVIAQANFDFSAACASGQTLYYQITDVDAHEVALVPPTSGGWGSYPRPQGDIIFPETVEHDGTTYDIVAIGDSTFYNCRGITGSIVLPDNIRTIGRVAFYGCSGVTGSLTLPQNLESMGWGAFWWLEYMTGSITIPQGVTRIEENTFFANRRITSYTIPASVTYIAQRGLGSGFRLESIYVDEDNPNYYVENNALIERDSKILLLGTKNTIIPDDVVEIGIAAFHFAAYAQNAQPLVIPNSVKIINDAAFHVACFPSISLPDSLIYIGNSAFVGDNTIVQSDLPQTLTHIGSLAFGNCWFVDGGVSIPEGIDTIASNTFNNSHITSVSIPITVVSIGEKAFYECDELQSITCYNSIPPVLDATSFHGVDKDIPVYIPYGSYDEYISTPYWNEFTNFIEMTDGPALNTEWYYEIQNENGSITYQHLECAADTTINHKEVTIIIRTNTLYDKGEHTEVTREYVYEVNDVLYWWNKDLEEFTVLYDFNVEEGDEWEVSVGEESITLHVDAVSEFVYYGIPYKALTVSDEEGVFSGTIVCGIGHMTSFFPEKLMTRGEEFSVEGIRCCWKNEELVFKMGNSDCDAIYNELHGIEEDSSSTGSGTLTVYPNPTDGVLFVETRHGTSLPTQTYRITNLMGQTLMTGQITSETDQINVSSLPDGMYFISVGDMTRKFVVR